MTRAILVRGAVFFSILSYTIRLFSSTRLHNVEENVMGERVQNQGHLTGSWFSEPPRVMFTLPGAPVEWLD